MTERKKHLMAKFYELCKQKGYKDMSDSTQSLKAKVIATDLGLNYGDIVAFYSEAKLCYEQVCAEKAEQEKELLKQYEKDAEERRRRAVNGELLLTLSGSISSSEKANLGVYIRPDNSIYTEIDVGRRSEGPPTIHVKKAGALLATYHPSEAVYTGATVGGITTGGVHYTKDGYSYSRDNQGKGEISVSAFGKEFALNSVTMSEYTKNRFKRDSKYRLLVDKGQILCYKNTEKADFYANGVALAAERGDITMAMNAASMAADERRLPYKECKEIMNLIGRIVNGQFPPTDEELYETAESYSNATNSADLRRAIDAFNSLGNYRDARQRANALKHKFDEILQYEKEQAILAKEAKQKNLKENIGKFKKIAMTLAVLVNLLVTVFLALMAWPMFDGETTVIAPIFIILSAIISIPGTGKLIFRKKYGLLQRILRWVIVVVVFFVGFVVFSLQQ